MKNSDFSNFDCDPEIMLKCLQPHGHLQWIPLQKTLWSTFFSEKKKNSVRHPKMVVYRFWDRTWDRFRKSKIVFSQNLTYSYSFLGWNSPGITMSLESLKNYFGITVKSRKNNEKFGFFEFWLWSRNNVELLATSRSSPVNSTPKNTMIIFFFRKKKKFRPTSQNGRLSILRSNLRPLSEIENFFFSKFNLLV